eukprot:298729-Amorphochlora_amoeboformis.AAC.1
MHLQKIPRISRKILKRSRKKVPEREQSEPQLNLTNPQASSQPLCDIDRHSHKSQGPALASNFSSNKLDI